jgi:hypothetical protein
MVVVSSIVLSPAFRQLASGENKGCECFHSLIENSLRPKVTNTSCNVSKSYHLVLKVRSKWFRFKVQIVHSTAKVRDDQLSRIHTF